MLKSIGKDMIITIERNKELEISLKKRLEIFNLVQSKKAMSIAKKYHIGKRKNGFDEISHQFEIVDITIPLFNSFKNTILDDLVAAMFLHDLIEGYSNKYNFLNLKNDFSNEVFDIVKRMTKTTNFKKTPKDYERYYKGLEKNPLSVIAKLLDRIHNYETMAERNISFKLRYFKEVNDYLIPMAERTSKKYSMYQEEINFLIRQLKVLTYFNMEIMYLKQNIKNNL